MEDFIQFVNHATFMKVPIVIWFWLGSVASLSSEESGPLAPFLLAFTLFVDGRG